MDSTDSTALDFPERNRAWTSGQPASERDLFVRLNRCGTLENALFFDRRVFRRIRFGEGPSRCGSRLSHGKPIGLCGVEQNRILLFGRSFRGCHGERASLPWGGDGSGTDSRYRRLHGVFFPSGRHLGRALVRGSSEDLIAVSRLRRHLPRGTQGIERFPEGKMERHQSLRKNHRRAGIPSMESRGFLDLPSGKLCRKNRSGSHLRRLPSADDGLARFVARLSMVKSPGT